MICNIDKSGALQIMTDTIIISANSDSALLANCLSDSDGQYFIPQIPWMSLGQLMDQLFY